MMLYTILISAMARLRIIAALYIAFAFLLARLWCKPKCLPATKSPADYGMEFERVKYLASPHRIAL